MKEKYLTSKNINKEIEGLFVDFLKKDRRKKGIKFDIGKSALLVIDVQKYFFDKNSHAYIPSSGAIKKNIFELIKYFRTENKPVFFTKHINSKKDNNMMLKWWGDIITSKSKYSKLIDNLDCKKNELIIKKEYDAFYNTPLDYELKKKKIKSVLITGVMTNLCCETTARSAFTRGYEVYFLIDATATYNRYFHYSTLLNLSYGFAIPVTTDMIISDK